MVGWPSKRRRPPRKTFLRGSLRWWFSSIFSLAIVLTHGSLLVMVVGSLLLQGVGATPWINTDLTSGAIMTVFLLFVVKRMAAIFAALMQHDEFTSDDGNIEAVFRHELEQRQ